MRRGTRQRPGEAQVTRPSDDLKILFKWFVIPWLIICTIDISIQVITNDCAPKIPFCTSNENIQS
jgi:hypothetical protein